MMTPNTRIMRKRPAPGRWVIFVFIVVSGTWCGQISTNPVVQAWAPTSTFGAASLRSSSTARFLIIEEHDTYFNRRDEDDEDDAHLFGASELTNITLTAQRKWKLAQAQQKIDAILNSPIDPPFDSEAEWKKVLSVSTPTFSSAEWGMEETTSRLEAELYQAVKASDFAKAANHSSALATLSLEDGALVLQANARFYQAFSEKNSEDMRSVWLSEVGDGDDDASCICIHPSHPPIVGTQAIVKSWSQMFRAGGSTSRASALGESRIEPHNIRLSVKATTAIVTCEEHVRKGDEEEGGDPPQKRLQATNIFRKVKGQWFMTHHHAAYHAESATVKAALQEKWNHKRGVDTTKAKSTKKGFQKPPTFPEMSILDKIVGMPEFGPVLGDKKGGPNDEDGDGNKPVKRIIMGGSLSDLLNGGLFDMTGDDDDDDDDDATIIEEDIEEDDEDSAEDKAMLLNIQNMARRDTQRKLQRQANLGGKSSPSDSERKKDMLREDQEEQARRRTGTLKLLRELVHQGRLSSKHKRLLLTDIIQCKANDEQSMVEVAYDLLYRSSVDDEEDEGEDDEDALEEFADQCLALARSLEMEETDPLYSE